jgi:NADH-quinone oxidoreductase subunit I
VILASGNPGQDWTERMHLPAILEGLGVSLERLLRKPCTIQYDGSERDNAAKYHTPREGYRGEHYLKKDEEGRVKCVACFMCAAACPAQCIHLEATATPPEWTERERAPRRFEIDLLRCIYCGMCEEACPVDAIALSKVYNVPADTREGLVVDLAALLKKGEELGLGLSRHRYRPDGVPGAAAGEQRHE